MLLFNAQNHIDLLESEIEAAVEATKAYGSYYTVVVEGKLSRARRSNNGLNIVGSYVAGAGAIEVFASEAFAMDLVRLHHSQGDRAMVARIDETMGKYITHLRASILALKGAIDL